MTKILLTGATGFIGSNIYKLLINNGYKVDCVVRKRDKRFKTIIIHDLTKPFPKKNYSKYDCIIHAAAYSTINEKDSAQIFSNNVISTNNLINFANHYKIKKIIFMSSISIYGDIQCKTINNNTRINKPSIYGLSKFVCEQLLKNTDNNFKSISIRLPGVLGHKSVRNLFTNFLYKIKKNINIELYNPDFRFNNCIHVNDLGQFVISLIKKKLIRHDHVVVGSKQSLRIFMIVKNMINKLNSSSKIKIKRSNMLSFNISNSYAIKYYNFKPKTVSSTINKFIEDNLK